MKIKAILLFIISMLISLSAFFQENKNKTFRENFDAANSLMNDNLYEFAKDIWLDLAISDSLNANVNYKTGYCLLNTALHKKDALKYLYKAKENINPRYNPYESSVKTVPIEVYYYLAKSFHLNYEMDSAEKYFNLFLNKASKKHHLKEITYHDLKQCITAKTIFAKPKEYVLKNIGPEINTPYSEYSPVLTVDESALFFTSRRLRTDPKVMSNKELYNPIDGKHYEDVYVSYKNSETDQWDPAELVTFSKNNSNQATISVTGDGKILYIYRDDAGGNGDIYYSEREDKGYVNLLPMKMINTDSWETHVTTSANGQSMYFVSDRKGGYGGRDIYKCVKLFDGEWSEPYNLGFPINTSFDEESPFLHSDGKTLYFSSNGEESMGGFDIFYSKLQRNQSWSQPKNLGYPLNTVEDDLFFTISADGKRGFYSSSHEGGYGEKDIYEILLEPSEPLIIETVQPLSDEVAEILAELNADSTDQESTEILVEEITEPVIVDSTEILAEEITDSVMIDSTEILVEEITELAIEDSTDILVEEKIESAQDTSKLKQYIDSVHVDKDIEEPRKFVFRPQLSMGVGMLTFYGDIGSNHQGYHPTVSRIGYTMRLINPINEYLDVSFYVLFGQLSVNERSLTRNLNFNSHITTGGITINYNFNHLFKKNRVIDPYIHLGIESIEFLSKTDLKDKNGNYYNYWSDGTIRNLSENDINASTAVEIFRDYTYESDIREENLDGFGKYLERSWGVPVEIGANLHAGKRLKFRIGAAMHFTFTDLIDGITHESVGDRVGDNKNDKMLFTHIALSYDLTLPDKRDKEVKPVEEDIFEYFRQDTIDSDGDLVVDHADLCAKTPLEAHPVDEFGCPLDGDNDGVPDYRDEELDTPEGAVVKANGVAYTDEDYELSYRMYKDSTDEFSEWDEVSETWGSDLSSPATIASKEKDTTPQLKLFIVIGSDVIGTTANQLYKELSNKDFNVIESGDSVLYVLGGYETIEAVSEVISDLEKDSLEVEAVVQVETNSDGQTDLVTELTDFVVVDSEDTVMTIEPDKEIIFRVQVGAFRRRLSLNVFKELPNMVYVMGDDSLYRYFSGAFTDKNSAASHRINMTTGGYYDAFIVAFQEGKRITLAEAGFEINPNFDDNIDLDTSASINPIDPDLIRFRVQVGAFIEKIPTEALDKYLELGNVYPKKDLASGFTKYYIGEFKTYQEALTYKDELIAKGLIDCFVSGEFKGNIITATEALQLLNK